MKSLRFILVDDEAAEDIVSTRPLQSEDFEQGGLLAHALVHGISESQLTSHTYILEGADGVYVLNDKSGQNNFLVIDLDNAPIFSDVSGRDALLRFQKLLRFARRRWVKISPAQNEKLIPGSTKAVIFPYPITTQSSVRITVELSPDKQRRARRSKGIELLAYRIGIDEGGGPSEEAPVTAFRRAIDGLPSAAQRVRSKSQGQKPNGTKIDSLSVTKLVGGAARNLIAGCDFEQWAEYLTSAQKDFVKKDLVAPHRIEGPAGTGKTLSLVLKCMSELNKARVRGIEHRAVFVAHSEATKRSIQEMFAPELAKNSFADSLLSLQTLKVTTLHELCSELLRYEVSETELLDRDAFESKQSQLLYTIEAIEEVMRNDLSSHKPYMAHSFFEFLESNDSWLLAEMLQHEIGVMIKGRAGEDLEKYKRLPRLKYGLPVINDGDRAFVFLIFRAYQKRLQTSGQFDTDDVVLSALSQLDAPIWRRRREKEGYDSIYVDETHLFNINELSIFHRLTRAPDHFPIAYSADVSQSMGDRGWSDVGFGEALLGKHEESQTSDETKFSSIFRCSPSIVELAFSVTSSGATLFTNFEDPLVAASSAFTDEEERKCEAPRYIFLPSDEEMIASAFSIAEEFVSAMDATRGDVAIIVFGNELFSSMEQAARGMNKPVEILKHRGDMEVVRKARMSGRFVLTTPDYVGGLEFSGVVLVGVDKGRVPPKFSRETFDSDNFISYATHQRLYVAITRARFRVAILGVKARGPTEVLANAITHNVLRVVDH